MPGLMILATAAAVGDMVVTSSSVRCEEAPKKKTYKNNTFYKNISDQMMSKVRANNYFSMKVV